LKFLQWAKPHLNKQIHGYKFLKGASKKEINDDKTWMCKRNMNIGIWNVRSLFWSGTLKVLHNELSKLDFDIAALQET